MSAAAHEGAPTRRIGNQKIKKKLNIPVHSAYGEALNRNSIELMLFN